MGNIYTGHEIVYAVAEGATFGTGVLDTAAAIELSSEAVIITPDVRHRVPNRYRGQSWHDVADISNDSYGALPNCVIPTEALKNEMAFWLYSVIQNVTEVGTTPYQKTFIFSSPAPDFSNNEGFFMTVWGKSPVASASEKIDSVIGEKLELSLAPDANDGNLYANLTLKGKGFSRTANPTGTWTKSAQNKFNFYNLATATLDGTDIILSSFSLSIENTIIPVGMDGSGGIQNVALSWRNVVAEVSGIWDAGMRTQLGNYDSGSEVILILEWGTTGNDGYLGITLHGVIESASIAEEDTRKVNLTIKGVSDIANTEDMLKVEIADAVQRNW